MSPGARRLLLSLAKAAMDAAVRGARAPAEPVDHPDLQGRQGAFVTLKNHGRLRGCLGNFTSDLPLWRLVRRMAAASATEDFRFAGDPITPAELPDITVEISVLSPLERIADPLDLELGTHGIYIRAHGRSGCFLPQVATETGWSREEFLATCCSQKASLPPDAWRDKDTEVLVFTAEVFGEADPKEG